MCEHDSESDRSNEGVDVADGDKERVGCPEKVSLFVAEGEAMQVAE